MLLLLGNSQGTKYEWRKPVLRATPASPWVSPIDGAFLSITTLRCEAAKVLGFLQFPDISLPEWVRCTRRDQRRTKLWEILFMEYLRQGLLCSLGWFRTHSADEASVLLSSASQALELHT